MIHSNHGKCRSSFIRCLFAIMAFAMILMAYRPFESYAATRQKIKSVSLSINSRITPGSICGDEEIDIKASGGSKYSFDTYEVLNVGEYWGLSEEPELDIYLSASDNYGFYISKASQIKVKGATYVSARREDNLSTLVVTVKLPALSTQVGELNSESIKLDPAGTGVVYWEPVINANKYRIRIYKNGELQGSSVRESETPYYDASAVLKRGGTYEFKVQPVYEYTLTEQNAVTQEQITKCQQNKGEWGVSSAFQLTDEQAHDYRLSDASAFVYPDELLQSLSKRMYEIEGRFVESMNRMQEEDESESDSESDTQEASFTSNTEDVSTGPAFDKRLKAGSE